MVKSADTCPGYMALNSSGRPSHGLYDIPVAATFNAHRASAFATCSVGARGCRDTLFPTSPPPYVLVEVEGVGLATNSSFCVFFSFIHCLCFAPSAWLITWYKPLFAQEMLLEHTKQYAANSFEESCTHQSPILFPLLSSFTSQDLLNLVFPPGIASLYHAVISCGKQLHVHLWSANKKQLFQSHCMWVEWNSFTITIQMAIFIFFNKHKIKNIHVCQWKWGSQASK